MFFNVTVTKQSQVQFINKPVEKAIGETFVNFTLPHWISFVSVASPQKRNAIKEGKEESFLYHGNRKVAKVLHESDTTTYQVHLMTFTAKGVPKRDLCVYLTEKEYEELEKLIAQINEFLDSTVPQTMKTFMKAYQWTLVSYEEADTEVCTKYYFCKEHAMREGTEAAQKAQVHVENIAITSNYIPLPEAMNFLKKVYMVMLYRACQYINNYLCTACQKHLPPHDTCHVTVAEGYKVTEMDLVGDNILFAREMCCDELIKKMFLTYWKNLDLPMVNMDSLLWDDMENNDIVELRAKKLDNVESKKDPHIMLIDDISAFGTESIVTLLLSDKDIRDRMTIAIFALTQFFASIQGKVQYVVKYCGTVV